MLLFLMTISCQDASEEKAYLIKNINVITMESDSVVTNTNVLIEGRKISKIFKEAPAKFPKKVTIINGKGKFLIPGLSDMHMHIDHPDVLKVNLAYGVTTVMNYRGLPEHLVLKEKSKTNEIFSPFIYTTGDYMEGYPATFPGFLSFRDTTGIAESIRKQKHAGYDFIKVYRNLDTLMHQKICDEARKNSMTVVGHLSPNISIQQSLEAGQKVIAHTEELMYFFKNENNEDEIKNLVEILKQNKTTYTPNLTIFRSLISQVRNIDSILSRDAINYVHPVIKQSWRKKYNINYSRGMGWSQFMEARFNFLVKVTRAIHKENMPILASTDAPTSGALPGLSLHYELQEFVTLGMTPFEALKTATVNPGEFINDNVSNIEYFGLVKEGYRADLLLLNKNPLQAIENTTSISGVFKNGSWYPREILDVKKEELAKHYKKVDSIIRVIEKNIDKGDITKAAEVHKDAKKRYKNDNFLGYYTMGYTGYRFLYQNRRLTTDSIIANKAVNFYKMYAQDYPNMHGTYYLLGMAFKAKKDTINAIKNFKKSLELHPQNPYAIRRLNEMEGTK